MVVLYFILNVNFNKINYQHYSDLLCPPCSGYFLTYIASGVLLVPDQVIALRHIQLCCVEVVKVARDELVLIVQITGQTYRDELLVR